jgi:hypothetical protein
MRAYFALACRKWGAMSISEHAPSEVHCRAVGWPGSAQHQVHWSGQVPRTICTWITGRYGPVFELTGAHRRVCEASLHRARFCGRRTQWHRIAAHGYFPRHNSRLHRGVHTENASHGALRHTPELFMKHKGLLNN